MYIAAKRLYQSNKLKKINTEAWLKQKEKGCSIQEIDWYIMWK